MTLSHAYPHNDRYYDNVEAMRPIADKLMASTMARTFELVGNPMILDLAHLAAKAVKRGEFTLSSGAKSDFYFDGRQVTLSRPALRLISEVVTRLVTSPGFGRVNAIGGPATAAIPITAGLLSTGLERIEKGFYVRSEPKKHGTGSQIEGPPLGPSDVVLLVDDTLTTGGSLIKAAKAVLETGATIAGVFVLVDREEGGAEAIEREIGGKPFAALTKTFLFFAMDAAEKAVAK